MSPLTLHPTLRRSLYVLLITLAAANTASRILAVTRIYEPALFRPPGMDNDAHGKWPATRPQPLAILGANDRSRWATIRALVEDGTFAIGQRVTIGTGSNARYEDVGIIAEDGWVTIDKVLKPDTLEFYSSKPPFLSTILAAEYWLLNHFLHWSITNDNPLVVRVILFTVNWVPLVFYLALLARS